MLKRWSERQGFESWYSKGILKVFVANQVEQIRDHASPKQCHHVESSSNPAGDALRGLDSKKKDQIRRWFDGPSFLWSRKQCWLEKSQLEEVSDEDQEVRKG